MEFKEIINTMTYLSLGFIAVEIYLSLNKLWKRKHEKVVAESISIGAKLISLTPALIFTIDFALSEKWASFFSYVLFLFSVLVQIAIGAGIWVVGKHKTGFWKLFGQSLQQESKEVGDLAKALFQTNHAQLIIEILVRVAQVDDFLDNREKKFIQAFAQNWNISFSWESYAYIKKENNVDKVRNCISQYLQTAPPLQQAQQLLDVLKMLVKIDDEISNKEEMLIEEVEGLVGNYLNNQAESACFKVAIVPQNFEQEQAIRVLLPKAALEKVAGGSAYIVGTFYSQRYAEIVCNRYRNFQFFSVAVFSTSKSEELEKELLEA